MKQANMIPTGKVLLIADCYADAINNLPHSLSRNCLEKIVMVRDAARRAGLLVCYSATVFREGFVEISDRNKLFSPRKNLGQPAIGDPIALIHPLLRPEIGEPVVGKRRVNAFYGTDFSVILNANDISEIVFLGFATSGVILSTVRYAADSDYRLVVVEDCCIDRDPETHKFLCENIFPYQADVVQSSDIIKNWATPQT